MFFPPISIFLPLLSSLYLTTTALPSPNLHNSRNHLTISKIYNLTTFPHNIPLLHHGPSALPAGLFSPNATGRISPLGNFTSFEDSVEYFYGLTSEPSDLNGWTAMVDFEIVGFVTECREVAASVVYLWSGEIDPRTGRGREEGRRVGLKQIALWRFDDNGAVLQYEAWIPNLQLYTNTMFTVFSDDNSLAPSSPSSSSFSSSSSSSSSFSTSPNPQKIPTPLQTITHLCTLIQTLCTGPHTQYTSLDHCISILSAKDFGTWDEAWGDNVTCRQVHVLLARLRPEVHCPHVGVLGGSEESGWKCRDMEYGREYFDDGGLFGGQGRPFVCREGEEGDGGMKRFGEELRRSLGNDE